MTELLHVEGVPGSAGEGDASPSLTEGFRLSPQQLRVWSLERRGEAPLSIGCTVLIEGDLDPDLLDRALRATIAHHEILRTTFGFVPGLAVPVQRIHWEAAPEMERMDATGVAPA